MITLDDLRRRALAAGLGEHSPSRIARAAGVSEASVIRIFRDGPQGAPRSWPAVARALGLAPSESSPPATP